MDFVEVLNESGTVNHGDQMGVAGAILVIQMQMISGTEIALNTRQQMHRASSA